MNNVLDSCTLLTPLAIVLHGVVSLPHVLVSDPLLSLTWTSPKRTRKSNYNEWNLETRTKRLLHDFIVANSPVFLVMNNVVNNVRNQ